MKSYRLAITDAPKKIRAEEQRLVNKWRFTYALARLLERHPALCSASGTQSLFPRYRYGNCLSAPGLGTRSVASGGVALLEVSDAS